MQRTSRLNNEKKEKEKRTPNRGRIDKLKKEISRDSRSFISDSYSVQNIFNEILFMMDRASRAGDDETRLITRTSVLCLASNDALLTAHEHLAILFDIIAIT
jgi:hypothetical protein